MMFRVGVVVNGEAGESRALAANSVNNDIATFLADQRVEAHSLNNFLCSPREYKTSRSPSFILPC